jgi:hypothetical protein
MSESVPDASASALNSSISASLVAESESNRVSTVPCASN